MHTIDNLTHDVELGRTVSFRTRWSVNRMITDEVSLCRNKNFYIPHSNFHGSHIEPRVFALSRRISAHLTRRRGQFRRKKRGRGACNYRSDVRFGTVDETTLLNELRAELIVAGPVGPLVCFSARITVHGCTVRANVIRAVLTSHLQLRHDNRK